MINWHLHKKGPAPPIACIARINDGNNGISFETHDLSQITTPLEVAPLLTKPDGDGVYSGDGSPPIGSFKWNKQTIKYCLVTPDANNQLVNIPNTHDLHISVNAAFTKAGLYTNLKFEQVNDWTQADISIKADKTDPIFTPPAGQTVSNVMAYCHFPNTTPQGKFTCVVNPDIMYSESGKFNFTYNFNETILHEAAGHGLGCVHTTNPKDIMYPFYHNDLRPTAMDIYQWQFNYGPRMPPVNPIEVEAFYVADSNRTFFPDHPN